MMRGYLFSLPLVLLAVSACDPEKTQITGKREIVMDVEHDLIVDQASAKERVILPGVIVNKSWPVSGTETLALSKTPKILWETKLDYPSDRFWKIAANPISYNGKIFAMDSGGAVYCVDVKNGEVLWRSLTTPQGKEGGISGGLAQGDNKVFVTTSFSELFAFDMKTGKQLWRKKMSAGGVPTFHDGKVYILNNDDKLSAYNAINGNSLWVHAALLEDTKLIGGYGCAIYGDVVLMPCTSGELSAVQSETGSLIWNEALSKVASVDVLASLPHIKAKPVVSDNMVFVAGYAGVCGAFDVISGTKKWEQEVGSAHSPVITPNSVILLSTGGSVVCLNKFNGRLRWSAKLPVNEEYQPNLWMGPILVEGRILVTHASAGKVFALSVENGSVIGTMSCDESLAVEPLVVDKKIIFVTESGKVVAFQ